MNIRSSFQIATVSLATLAIFIPSQAPAAAVVRAFGGDTTPASITPVRDQFRIDLGGGITVGGNGSFGGLRREINWDGVPAGFSAPNLLPANFFNVNSPRGAVFSTPGTGFQVSSATTDAGAGQPAAANFGNINTPYSTTFGVFSAQRLFTAVGSSILDVNFFLPGTTTPATVSGFGSIFTDVDSASSTTIEYFNELNSSLGVFAVPTGIVPGGSAFGNQSLSFLGVSFNAGEKVRRVRISSGNFTLGSGVNDNPAGGVDVVAMDDFIYSEPVPEPSALFLCAAGLAGLLSVRKRNSRVSA